MAVRWKRGLISGEQSMLTFKASGTVVVGVPVRLVAPASHGAMPLVASITGGSADKDIAFGIPQHGAANGEEVMVRPIFPGDVYEVDADANSDYTAIGSYAGFNTDKELVVGVADLGATKMLILDVVGLTAEKKYEAMFAERADPNSLFVQVVPITADASAAISFVMLETIEILDVIVQARALAASSTLQLRTAADTAISSAIACAADGAVTHTATLDDAVSIVTKGQTLEIIAASGTPANARGLVTIIGRRL